MQPGSQERPEAFHGVDVDLAEAIAVLVAGVFASTMTDGLVTVAETRESGIDAILVSIDVRAFGDSLLDDRMEGRLLDIGQHPDHDLAAALNHAEDRRLFLLKGAAPAAALQSVAPAFATRPRAFHHPGTRQEPPDLTTGRRLPNGIISII